MVHSTCIVNSERWRWWKGWLEFYNQLHKQLWWSEKELPTGTGPSAIAKKNATQMQKMPWVGHNTNLITLSWKPPPPPACRQMIKTCICVYWEQGQGKWLYNKIERMRIKICVHYIIFWILKWCYLPNVLDSKASSYHRHQYYILSLCKLYDECQNQTPLYPISITSELR